MRFPTFLAAISFVVVSVAAHAETIYTYAGQNFTQAEGLYTVNDHISGFFTLAEPLPPNLNEAQIFPLNYSFTDGVQTATSDDSGGFFGFISTDATGNFTEYIITIATQGDGLIQIDLTPAFSGDSGAVRDLNRPDDAMSLVPGTFTISSTTTVTPEPFTFVLLGTGLLGMTGFVRKKSSNNII